MLLGTRPYSRPMRQLLWLNLFYQFTTLFTVIVNPYAANTFEWFHAWLLVSGSLIVGWALGRAGYARLALLLIVGTACVIAVGTMLTGLLQYASGNFSAVYPAMAAADAQELRGNGDGVRRGRRLRQSGVDLRGRRIGRASSSGCCWSPSS